MIDSITIEGFRGIRDTVTLALAPLTLLSGRNGLGKTTVFDAIDWCIFGATSRFGEEGEGVRNLYGEECEPRVKLTLRCRDRSFVLDRCLQAIRLDGQPATDKDILNLCVSDLDVFAPYARDQLHRVRRLLYLPQDEIRALVASNNDSERKALVQTLLGVPEIAAFESGVRRADQHIRGRLRDALSSMAELDKRISELSAMDGRPDTSGIEIADARQRAQQILSLPDAEDISTSVLLEACHTDHGKVARQISALEVWLQSYRDYRTQQADHEVMKKEVALRLQELARELKEAEATLTSHSSLLSQTEAARSLLDREIVDASSTLRTAERALAAAREVALAQQERSGAAESLNEAESLIVDLNEKLALDVGSAAQADQELAQLRSRMDLLREQLQSVNRQATLQTSLTEARQRTVDLRQSRAQTDQEIARLSAIAKTSTEQAESVQTRVNATELLAQCKRDAAQAIQLLDLTDCPLCGNPFTDTTTLLSHLAGMAPTSPGQLALEDARQDERAANELLTQAKNRHARLTVELQSAEQHQRDLESDPSLSNAVAEPSNPLSIAKQIDSAAEEFDRLTNTRSQLEQSLSVRRRTLAEAQAARRRANDALRDIAERVAAAQVDSTAGQMEAQTLKDYESQRQIASSRVADLSGRRQTLLKQAEEQTRLMQLASLDVERIRADVERQNAAIGQSATVLERRYSALASEEADVSTSGESNARARLQGLQRRYALLAQLEHDLKVAIRLEDWKLTADETEHLRVERARLEVQQSALRRAIARLTEVEATVTRRAQREARQSLMRFSATTQDCLAALYPHQHLNTLDADGISDGKLRLTDDRIDRSVDPGIYSSTGQLNALALALFVGASLQQRLLTFRAMLMDEPVQNLDDVRFLALVTLLKRLSESAQVVVSTADSNMASIMDRQLRNSWPGQPTHYAHYRWVSFTAELGPRITRSPNIRQLADSAA